MNNVLITGLGVAKELGICQSCNLDYSWLINNLSILLWADQIYIPRTSFESEIIRNEQKQEKVIGLFLNMAAKQGIINKVDLSNMYQDTVGEEIYKKMLVDSKALLQAFPETVRKGEEGVPDEIIIGDEGYCGAWLASIYAGMKVAKDLGANCLFSKREHNFLKYLYGLDANRLGGSAINSVYREIFSLYMPEGMTIHNYAFVDEQDCQNCIHYEKCRDSYLSDTEKTLEKVFKWREFDELQQAKKEIDRIIKIKNDICTSKDVEDVVKEFKERQNNINKNINKRFPQIKRWTKMTTVIATPITIAAAITGNVPLTIGSAAATGLAQSAEHLIDIYKSKNNWVGFVNDMKKI